MNIKFEKKNTLKLLRLCLKQRPHERQSGPHYNKIEFLVKN